MFFRKQKRINELEKEVSKLRESIDTISSDSRFRNNISTKVVSDMLNFLSMKGILSDIDCFNIAVPYNIEVVDSSYLNNEQERYIIRIPNISLNVSKEVHDKYFKV